MRNINTSTELVEFLKTSDEGDTVKLLDRFIVYRFWDKVSLSNDSCCDICTYSCYSFTAEDIADAILDDIPRYLRNRTRSRFITISGNGTKVEM